MKQDFSTPLVHFRIPRIPLLFRSTADTSAQAVHHDE